MTGRSRLLATVLAASAMLTAGCSDSTAPAEPFDPARTEADLAVLAGVMGNTQLAAFAAMSSYFDLGGAASATIGSARTFVSSGGTLSGVTAHRMAIAAAEGLALRSAGGATPSLEVLPPSVLGTTFVFDSETQAYIASNRTGAPANGVRFIVYAIDPLSGAPIVDTEVGHADLIDTSIGSQTSVGMRLLLVGGTTTYLDYAFSATASQSSALLRVDGYLTDGTTRLNFDVDMSMAIVQEELTVDVDFSFVVPSRSFSITGSIDGAASSTGGFGNVSLSIVSGGARVRFEIAQDVSTVNATVYVNGRIFATITGDPGTPIVSGAGGAELTAEEVEVLGDLLQLSETMFELLGTLFAPIGLAGSVAAP